MKNIVVTGASKGIGYQTALILAKSDNRVFAIARSEEELNKLSESSDNGEIIALTADLSDAEDINRISEIISEYSSVDVLINNAGLLINKPFMETSIDEWQRQIDVNLLGPVRIIKALKPYLATGSHIVNISSMGGFQGSSKFPGLAAYSASKGALSVLTESLSTEFADDGVVVNCLCLGAVQTEMLNLAFPGFKAPISPAEMARYISEFALKAHKYMNGRVLPVALNNPV